MSFRGVVGAALCTLAIAAHAADLPAGLSRFNPAGLAAEWTYEGVAFRALSKPGADTVPVHRLRHPQKGYRLAASEEEREAARGEGFEAERVVFHAPAKGGVAVHGYRDDAGHRFYSAERKPPSPGGWTDAGVAFRGYARGTGPADAADVWRYRRGDSGTWLFTASDESPYVVGAFYFGLFSPSGTQSIEGTERVHGRKNDWWGGVSDFYGREKGIPADRRGWSGDFSELKPAIGYYDQRSVDTLEKHIRQASDAGLSFFGFYWYWSRAKQGERLPEAMRSFLAARNPAGLRFNLALYAHPWDDDMAIDPSNQDAVIAKLLEAFADARYLRLPDARPVFVIGDVRNIRADDGKKCGTTPCMVAATGRFVAALKAASRAKLGVQPFVQMQPGPGWDAIAQADGATCLLPPVEVAGGTPYPRLDASVFAPWAKSGRPFSPCMMENFDERPRQDVQIRERAAVRYFTGKTEALFRNNLGAAKRYSDEAAARGEGPAARIVYLYAWNEWHEGGILEPNATTGARDLNVVTDVFQLSREPSRCLDQGECAAAR